MEHLLIQCIKYTNQRKRLIDKLKETIGGIKWEEISSKENTGYSYMLGFDDDIPEDVIYKPKRYLEINVWKMRMIA